VSNQGAILNEQAELDIGITADGRTISLPLKCLNRHGIVSGSTGTGKTRTLQRIVEQLSAVGVPVFCADIKGDLSGLSNCCPTQFWDLYGKNGLPIRTSVQEMGCELLARMLNLNEVQTGTLAIAFRKAEDDKDFMLTLDDLRYVLIDILDDREAVSRKYGNVTGASINSIQRNLLTLESQGGINLFGEPGFDIFDLMRTGEGGNGIVNLLHADKLIEAPKLYATFLLWLLTELFRVLPEIGDRDKPKLVFFFDESHLLFTDSPKMLVQKIERLVRLVRSKGVGVFFVTQSVSDVPEAVLAQLGSKIQHALRAFTPRDQKMIKATAASFRENSGIDVKAGITTLRVGEAFISVMDADGVPTKVEQIRVTKPTGQFYPISEQEREIVMEASPLREKYAYGLPEGEAATLFDNRMREERGLPILVKNGDWPEGKYLEYLPDWTLETAPNLARVKAWRDLKSALLSFVCLAGIIYIRTHS
jgi:uncharacterized protein